jgi:predicted acyltransferase
MHLPWFLDWISWWEGHLSHATLTLAGMFIGLLYLDVARSDKDRIKWTVVAGVLFMIAGFFVRPLYGISKIHATPSWVMYCSAICCFLFAGIYWLVDVKGFKNWATFLKPAGTNPLLTYILPSIFYAAVGYSFAPDLFSAGILGIIKSVLFSFFILACASLLTRMKILLHL